MKQTFGKLLLLLLAFSLVVTTFVGCNRTGEEDGTDTQADTQEPSETDDGYQSIDEWLPQQNFGNGETPRQVVMLTFPEYSTKYHLIEYEYDNVLSQVAVERTLYINEYFNVDMVYEESRTIQQTLEQSVMTGGGNYDFVYPHAESAFPIMIVSGTFRDLRQYDAFNFDQPWWNQSSIETYTVNGKMFNASCDTSISGQGFTSILVNRKIYDSLNTGEDIYEIVHDGKWTMEKMITLTRSYGTIIEGSDGTEDTYGLAFNEQYSTSFLYGMEQTIAAKNDAGEYSLAFDNEKVNNIAQKLYDLVWGSGDKIKSEYANYGQYPTSEIWKTFEGGRALMTTFALGSLYYLLHESDNIDFDIAYLPTPKFDEAQKEYYVSTGAGFFCIPTSASDPEMSSVLLEAMAIYSYSEYRPLFFETILMGRLSDHEEDYEMLEFLHSRKTYDIGYTFDSEGIAVDMLINVVINKKSTNTASYITARRTQFNKIFENIDALRNATQ